MLAPGSNDYHRANPWILDPRSRVRTVVVGDRRPYLTCLVMIDQENVTKFAQDNDVPFTNYTSLCHAQEVKDLFLQPTLPASRFRTGQIASGDKVIG